VNKKDFKDHKSLAKTMNWSDLVDTLIDIEIEYNELKGILSKKEINIYTSIIDIYEKEKKSRLSHTKVSFGSSLEYGLDYVSDWNYDDDEY